MNIARVSFVLSAAALIAGFQAAPAGQIAQGREPSPQTSAAQPPNTGLVMGQVVDGSSGAPIGGAIVTLTIPRAEVAGPSPNGPQPAGRAGGPVGASSQRVMADGGGRFMFHDLPKGALSLTATAAGYMPGSYGQRRPNGGGRPVTLDDGERIGNATIRMWKYAVVSGTVTDEVGEPLVDVNVSLRRRLFTNGQSRLAPAANSRTDDRGAYLFSSLVPGDYLVCLPSTTTSVPVALVDEYWNALTRLANPAPAGRGAPPPPSPAQTLTTELGESSAPRPLNGGYLLGDAEVQPSDGLGRAAPPPGPDGRLLVYPQTFYPGVSSPAQAQFLTIGSGETRAGIDLSVKLTPTVRVSGTVVGPNGLAPHMGVHLVPVFADAWTSVDASVASTATDAAGTFTLLGVPPGQYVAKVLRTPQAYYQDMAFGAIGGRAGVTSGGADANTQWAAAPVTVGETDVADLTLTLRPGLEITGRVVFDGTSPAPTGAQLSRTAVMANALDGQENTARPAAITPNGQFTLTGYLPGRYVLNASGQSPWTLRSIVAGGHEISATPFTLDSDVSDVVVTLTDRPTKLTGTVTLDSPKDPQPTVVIVPANTDVWISAGMPSRMTRTLGLTSTRFAVTGLPAGDYLIAAVPDEATPDMQDPAAVQAIARVATRISLSEGQQTTVDLRLAAIR